VSLLTPLFLLCVLAVSLTGWRRNGWLWRYSARASDEFVVVRPPDEVLRVVAAFGWHQYVWKPMPADGEAGTLTLSCGRTLFTQPRRLRVVATSAGGGTHVEVTATIGALFDVTHKNRRLIADLRRALTELPSAAWFPDPWQQSRLRWWDGAGWTANLA
jgi:hypothetical protein